MNTADCLAGFGRPTTEQPSTGGARQVQDPAARSAPVSRRAARATVPGGPGPAVPPSGPGGKTSQTSRPGRSQRGAGTGPGSSTEADGAVPGGGEPGRGDPGTTPLRPGQDAIAAAMSEAELLSNVTDGTRKRPGLCKLYGLRWYHTHNSRRSPSGFPDLVIVGRRTMYRELKRQKENPTRVQREWIAALEAAGEDVGVWRPADWHSGRIQRELAGLAGIRGAG